MVEIGTTTPATLESRARPRAAAARATPELRAAAKGSDRIERIVARIAALWCGRTGGLENEIRRIVFFFDVFVAQK